MIGTGFGGKSCDEANKTETHICAPGCEKECCTEKAKTCEAGCTKACCTEKSKTCEPGCTKACCADKKVEKMVLKFMTDSTELTVESINGEVTWTPSKPDSLSDEIKAELEAAGIEL
jgi:hypothetical protein